MNYIKFYLSMLLVPVYFMVVFIKELIDAFKWARLETASAVRSAKRKHFN